MGLPSHVYPGPTELGAYYDAGSSTRRTANRVHRLRLAAGIAAKQLLFIMLAARSQVSLTNRYGSLLLAGSLSLVLSSQMARS